MGQQPNKYHITDEGNVYKINEDGSFTDMGNIEDRNQITACPKTQYRKPFQTDITFVDDIRFQASLVGSFNTKGGQLHLYPESFGFKPHRFNFGSHREEVFSICQITGYRKNALMSFSIYLDCGTLEFTVWQKDTIIDELEKRRRAYYTNRGLEIPPLQVI